MPYYIYRIHAPLRRLEKIEEHERFATASGRAKQLRGELPLGGNTQVRVFFAENELQAEDRLSQAAQERPFTGDED